MIIFGINNTGNALQNKTYLLIYIQGFSDSDLLK